MRNSTGKSFLTKWTTQNYHLAFEVTKEKYIYYILTRGASDNCLNLSLQCSTQYFFEERIFKMSLILYAFLEVEKSSPRSKQRLT